MHGQWSNSHGMPPPPLSLGVVLLEKVDGETPMSRPSDDDAPFSALAFKIMTDPFVGTLTFTRIYSGVLESGTSVFNSVKVIMMMMMMMS